MHRTIGWVNAPVSISDILLAVAHLAMAKTSKGWLVNMIGLILLTTCKDAKPHTFDVIAFVRFYL